MRKSRDQIGETSVVRCPMSTPDTGRRRPDGDRVVPLIPDPRSLHWRYFTLVHLSVRPMNEKPM